MVATIIFLTVFFVLGTSLILITHRALVAEEARCIARVSQPLPARDGPMQRQPQDRTS
jgi:hypothetical protein